MPVARLTNIANFDALLGEIRNFLNSNGWTIEEDLRSPTAGAAAGGRELVVSQGDCLALLRSTTGGAAGHGLLLYDGIPPYSSSVIGALPGHSGIRANDTDIDTASDSTNTRNIFPKFAGPFPTAYLFTDDPSTYCHIVVECTAGIFRHVWFGNLEKFGTWTGGGYYSLERWSQAASGIDQPASNQHVVGMDDAVGTTSPPIAKHFTVHFEDEDADWRSSGNGTLNGVARFTAIGSMRNGMGSPFRSLAETPYSGLIALVPVTFWPIQTLDTPNTARCAGRVKDVAEVNIKNLVPGESYFIGSDEWIVFPLSRKPPDPSERLDIENSGWFGLAYKVIP